MRVVYCGAFRLPCFDAAAQRVLNNAKSFRALGHEVYFISWGGRYREQDLCLDGKYRVEGFEYVITDELDATGIWNKISLRFNRGVKSYSILARTEKKLDLIIMYNASYCWTRKMIGFCRKRNIKLANDITEWYSNNELYLPDIIPNALNMRILQHCVPNKIVISSFLNKCYPESNNLLMPPICDPSESKWSQVVEDDRITTFDGVTLVYAGNPTKKDCLHTIINAVNVLASEGEKIRFLILGTTRENYLMFYRKLLNIGDIHKNIIFLGHVSQELVPAYYRKADFMVLLRESNRKSNAGFPTKVAEAMTAKIPVICNATSDLLEYVHDGKNGFLVGGYTLEDILKTLRERVLPLGREDIEQIKKNTSSTNSVFAYSYYNKEVHHFLNNLK